MYLFWNNRVVYSAIKKKQFASIQRKHKEISMINNLLGDIKDRPVQESSTAHVALSLVLDVSSSMQLGNKIGALNDAINKMIEQLKVDARLRYIVDLGIFVFGEQNKETICQGFRAIADCGQMSLQANDESTYVSDALNTALDRLTERRHLYEKGGGAYKPWLILITDGAFHDSSYTLDVTGSRIKELENNGKLHFFGLGVDDFKREQLENFAVDKKRVIELKAANFEEFFNWVGRSMSTVSDSTVGESVQLEPLIFTV